MSDVLTELREQAKINPQAQGALNALNEMEKRFTAVAIEGGDQPWCTIYLEDGHKLRIQLTVIGIYREDNMKNPDGTPVYHVATINPLVQAFPRKQRK